VIGRAVRQALLLAALGLAPALVCGGLQLQWKHEEPLAEGEVSVATARAWGAQALFVDARKRDRFDAGHIPQALLLNDEEWDALLPKFLDAWDPDGKIVVYCDGGGCEASKEIATRLREQLQLKNVYVLKGGWPAWEHR
jgi:rhodanese-related sulfurtransferase